MTDQVLCIKPCRRPPWHSFGEEAVKGEIYTIRGVNPSTENKRAGYLFEEIRTGHLRRCGQEIGYAQKNFVPIKDSNLDVFREMFKPLPTKQKELLDQ